MSLIVAAFALAVAATIIITIGGIITKDKIRQESNNRDIDGDLLVEKIDNCTNIVTLKELYGDKKIEIQGDAISSDIYEGIVISKVLDDDITSCNPLDVPGILNDNVVLNDLLHAPSTLLDDDIPVPVEIV